MKTGNRILSSRRAGYSGREPITLRAECSCGEMRARRRRATGSVAARRSEPRELEIPEPLRMDQNELCIALERATLSGGRTGRAARELRAVLQPHLLREEEDLLQTLGLLLPLAQGKITPGMRSVASRTEHLKSRMFEIMREHVVIIEAAHKLLRAARSERKLALVGFTEHLMLRAWTDEVVFYPTAILIGEYLKLRFSGRAPHGREEL